MALMATKRRGDTVILGPCPGCLNWQVEYTDEVARSFYQTRVDEIWEFGSAEPVEYAAGFDTSAWADALEEVLRDHLNECPELGYLLD